MNDSLRPMNLGIGAPKEFVIPRNQRPILKDNQASPSKPDKLDLASTSGTTKTPKAANNNRRASMLGAGFAQGFMGLKSKMTKIWKKKDESSEDEEQPDDPKVQELARNKFYDSIRKKFASKLSKDSIDPD
jgi:hypothetical protein